MTPVAFPDRVADEVLFRDLDGDGAAELLMVEPDLREWHWTAEAWRWDGTALGCTQPVRGRETLAQWLRESAAADAFSGDHCFDA